MAPRIGSLVRAAGIGGAAVLPRGAPIRADTVFIDGYERPLPPQAPVWTTVGASQAAARIQRADPNGNPYTEISGLALSRRQQADGAPLALATRALRPLQPRGFVLTISASRPHGPASADAATPRAGSRGRG
jgi:hypothetical protein